MLFTRYRHDPPESTKEFEGHRNATVMFPAFAGCARDDGVQENLVEVACPWILFPKISCLQSKETHFYQQLQSETRYLKQANHQAAIQIKRYEVCMLPRLELPEQMSVYAP